MYLQHVNASATCECIMSCIWISHVRRIDESCHTYEWVMSHIWMSHVIHMNESCHTYEWVVSHVRMSHIYAWVKSRIQGRTLLCVISVFPLHTNDSHVTQTIRTSHDSDVTLMIEQRSHICMNQVEESESQMSHKWVMIEQYMSHERVRWHCRIRRAWLVGVYTCHVRHVYVLQTCVCVTDKERLGGTERAQTGEKRETGKGVIWRHGETEIERKRHRKGENRERERRIHTYTHTHIKAHARTHIYTHTNTQKNTHTCTRTHAHAHTHTQAHTHTHTRTHAHTRQHQGWDVPSHPPSFLLVQILPRTQIYVFVWHVYT